MPLPHFLLLLAAAIVAAALTIWAAFAAGLPVVLLGLAAVVGAVLTHLAEPLNRKNSGRAASDGAYHLPKEKS